MLQAWKRKHVITYTGYILGFPTDTHESVARDIAIIQRDLPIDTFWSSLFSFRSLDPKITRTFIGAASGWIRMSTSMTRTRMYGASADDGQGVAGYLRSSLAFVLFPGAHRDADQTGRSLGMPTGGTASMIFIFMGATLLNGFTSCRAGSFAANQAPNAGRDCRRESVIGFSVRRIREVLATYVPALALLAKIELARRRIRKDPASKHYTDIAQSAVDADLTGDGLELFRATESAREAAKQARERLEKEHRRQASIART